MTSIPLRTLSPAPPFPPLSVGVALGDYMRVLFHLQVQPQQSAARPTRQRWFAIQSDGERALVRTQLLVRFCVSFPFLIQKMKCAPIATVAIHCAHCSAKKNPHTQKKHHALDLCLRDSRDSVASPCGAVVPATATSWFAPSTLSLPVRQRKRSLAASAGLVRRLLQRAHACTTCN